MADPALHQQVLGQHRAGWLRSAFPKI